MSQAKDGDNVAVHYTGKLVDGSIFDTSTSGEPLAFTLGTGQLITGFEEAVRGMLVGEKKTVTIPPEKGYGERHEEMVVHIPKSQVPADITPEVGMQLQLTNENNQPIVVVITEVSADSITLDGNPPLAGQTLVFDLELVSIG